MGLWSTGFLERMEEAGFYKKPEMVEVVRCKDCKYGEKANAVYLCGKSRGFGIAHEPKWFCADGKRKSD